MICFCSCTKNSSLPENHKQRASLKSCKICGGKLLVDGRGAQQKNMSNGGLELSRVIDPHLTWKTASNGRQRAVRRARTSFTGAVSRKSPARSSKVGKDLPDKDSKSTGNMPVSESEKVGVSILGRRFNDALGSVPIKKRRFLLDHPSSPTHSSSSHPAESGHILERHTALHQGAVLTTTQHYPDYRDTMPVFEKSDAEVLTGKICDAVDFSGISILAAAACDSNIGGDVMDVECSLSKPLEVLGIPEEKAELKSSPGSKEESLPHNPDNLVGERDLPRETSSLLVLPCKELNEVKSDRSCHQQTSVNSLQNGTDVTTTSSSGDVKFHWDLNTVMDLWECHEDLNSVMHDTDGVNKGPDDTGKRGCMESSLDQLGNHDSKIVPADSQRVDDRALSGGDEQKVTCVQANIEEKSSIVHDNLAVETKERKSLLSSHEDTPVEDRHLKNSKLAVAVYEETKPLIKKDDGGSVSGQFSSPVRDGVVSLADSDALSAEGKEAHNVILYPKLETENSSRCVPCDNAVYHPMDVSEPCHGLDNELTGTVVDVQMAEVTQRSHQTDHQSPCVNLGTVERSASLSVCSTAEKGSELLGDRFTCENVVSSYCAAAATSYMNTLDETEHDVDDESKAKDLREKGAAGMKTEGSNAADNVITRREFLVSCTSRASICRSTSVTPCNTDTPLSSQEVCKNNLHGSASSPGQINSGNDPQGPYYSNASQNDAEQLGMEKVEFLGDDDSQYEDGEFRESLANCWLDDAGEEGETERVDYGSDRDTDVCVAASDFPSVYRHVNSVDVPDAGYDNQDREAGKDATNVSRSSCRSPSQVIALDAGTGNEFQGNFRPVGKDSSGGDDVGERESFKEADSAGRFSHHTSFSKRSGWDRLPGSFRNSGNGVICRNRDDASLETSCDNDVRVSGSSFRREFSSRIDRMQSCDMSQRNDSSYVRPIRSSDHNGFIRRVERNKDDHRSIGRSGPSLHLQARGRGDHWVDSSSHHCNGRHDSSNYNSGFKHHGSRNAAAAAVAKVESNGFIVAPDGTIVKAASSGSSGHLIRRSVKSSAQNTRRSPMGRGSPIERERPYGMPSGRGRSREMIPDGPIFAGRGKGRRYGPGVDGVSHRERCHGPVADGILDSSSMHHMISRRDRSYSPPHRRPLHLSRSPPHRRPLHLSRSHSRSPSRSRTRSPHRWVSPRGNGMNCPPSLRRRSRSPGFRSEARMGRPRASFGERVGGYGSLPRNRPSPPHGSRWNDGRKNLQEHFREYGYRQCPGRNPPERVFSRVHRFDSVDYPGRQKPNGYCRPTNSGRYPEYVGYGRGSGHDGRREHGNRYEMLHSARQYVSDGNMKCLRYDGDNSFVDQNPRTKSSEFQRRDSPSAFDRGTESQPADSPRRSKEENGHHDKWQGWES